MHDQFDHYLLNDLPHFKGKSPSTEIVAQTIL
ncbi:6-carboxytetrahydropterin synthase [Staphylococcus aureus]